ncbi:hypothetical protein [Haladaptatus sp. DFWS20]|uniref:hypothetical protein n=1 Tax=Haladaptatus sp. DFWS20 TaxID=3403467 RepID=UPI003EB89C9A
MSSDNTDTKKRGRKAYHLSESQRVYLETGDTGTYRESRVREDITTKVNRLATRLNLLCEDVRLLANGVTNLGSMDAEHDETDEHVFDVRDGFLTPDTWLDGWLQLLGIEGRPSAEELASELTSTPAPGGQSRATVFGAKLGAMVRRMMLFPNIRDVEQSDIAADVIWGVFTGLWLNQWKLGERTGERVRNESTMLLEKLEERAGQSVMRADAQLDMADRELVQPIQRTNERQAKIRQHVDNILDRKELASSTWIVEQVTNHVLEQLGERYNFDMGAPSSPVVLTGFASDAQVEKILTDNQLIEKNEIRQRFEQDIASLNNKEWRGVPARDVFDKIANHDGSISSSELDSKVRREPDDERAITRLARDFAGIDCEKRPESTATWTEVPLVQDVEPRQNKSRWTTTLYGDALHAYLEQIEAPSLLRGGRDIPAGVNLEDVLKEIGDKSV